MKMGIQLKTYKVWSEILVRVRKARWHTFIKNSEEYSSQALRYNVFHSVHSPAT